MNKARNSPNHSKTARRAAAIRFTLGAATLGLLAGLYEAAILHRTPRIAALVYPDLQYVIFFIAPLADMLLFAIVGLGLGLLAGAEGGRSPRRTAFLIAIGLGLAGTFATSIVKFLHVGVRDLYKLQRLEGPCVWFTSIFVLALTVAGFWRSGLLKIHDPEIPWPVRRWSQGLLVAGLVLLSGIGFYVAQRHSWLISARASTVKSPKGPNIIFITLDTVRADHLSSYGYSRPTTPYLDKLAGQGVLFENAMAASSWTLASHASMFTGLLPHQHGANWAIPLDTAPWTLAEVLKALGYETAGFTSNLYYSQAGWGMAQGFENYEDDSYSLRHNLAATLVGLTLVQPLYRTLWRADQFDRRDAHCLTRDVLEWLRRRAGGPFFLFINYFDAHTPYLPPSSYARRFGQLSPSLEKQGRAVILGKKGAKAFTAPETALYMGSYDNCLAYLDEQVGRLIQALEGMPEWPNTILIITSDHGEAFGEHGFYSHGASLYREEIHVPLIVVGPGIPSGRRIAHIVPTRAIFPTVLDLVVGSGSPFRQTSLARYWSPGFQPEHYDEVVVSELVIPSFRLSRSLSVISLANSQWHYLHFANGQEEVYEWARDPQEKLDLVSDPQAKDTLVGMRERLEGMIAVSPRPWRDPAYLMALDSPTRSFLTDLALGRLAAPPKELAQHPVGISQTYFAPARSSLAHRPLPPQMELVKSLPYD